MADSSDSDIFDTLLSPVRVGRYTLSHRVVLAPMTRCRALNSMPQRAHVEYYQQRTTPFGLLITEGVAVSPQAFLTLRGFSRRSKWRPGRLSWKPYTAKVASFSVSCGTLVARRTDVSALLLILPSAGKMRILSLFTCFTRVMSLCTTDYQPNGGAPISSTCNPVPAPWTIRMPEGKPSDVPYSTPRAASTNEIAEVVQQFRAAARNVMAAGFDGVEVHAAHGYLIDQFFKDGINDRRDKYGGSVEKRCRMGLEVVNAVVEEIGAERTGVRISPIIDHLGAIDSNPRALGLHLVQQLNQLRPCLAYLHMTEPRFTSQGVVTSCTQTCQEFSAAFEGVVISSGGYTRESGMEAIRRGHAHLVAYGRLFISNPDLPLRFALGMRLRPYDRATFYSHHQVKGFTDYPLLPMTHLLLRFKMPTSPTSRDGPTATTPGTVHDFLGPNHPFYCVREISDRLEMALPPLEKEIEF